MADIRDVVGGTRCEVVENLDWDNYRSTVGLNPSTIVKAIRGREDDGTLILSMRRLKWAWDNAGGFDSDDLLWGRAVHCLLFERDQFGCRYARWEEGKQRRGRAYDDFRLDNHGKEILSATQWDAALLAAESFVENPLVQDLIACGRPEVTVFQTEYGLQCRGRLDWVRSPTLGRVIVDLKTTKNIAPRAFGHDFFKYHYDIKLGLYRRWLDKTLQDGQTPVTVIALEKDQDNDTAVIPIPDAVLDYGVEKGLRVIREVRKCIETGRWPGLAGDDEFYLHVPGSEMEIVDLEGAVDYEEAG